MAEYDDIKGWDTAERIISPEQLKAWKEFAKREPMPAHELTEKYRIELPQFKKPWWKFW